MAVSIPGYRDFSLLARGGFATVYQARQEAYDRLVAVKVLDAGISDEQLRRQVERERAGAGRLTGHPNIVTVLDSGYLDDGRPFLAMALCPGGSVADQLARQGPLPVAEVLRIGVKISGALHTAHQHDLVHRDVKPENILITGYGEPALSDFGIATGTDPRALTRSAQAYTPNHAAPEVLRGQPATPASDVYSLGSTLYQLLAGRAPFAADSGGAGLASFVDRVLNREPPPLPRDDVPPSLAQVLRQAMAKQPADRFSSAHAMAQALAQVQQELGEQVDGIPVLPAGAGQAPPGADETIRPPAPPPAAGPLAGPPTVLGSRVNDLAPPASASAAPDRHRRGRRVALVAATALVLLIGGAGAVFAVTSGPGGGGGSGPGAAASHAASDPPTTPLASAAGDQPPDSGAGGPGGGGPPPPEPEVTSLAVTGVECHIPQIAGGWRGVVTVSWEAVRADNVQVFLPTTATFAGGYDEVRGSDTFEVECDPGAEFQVRVVAQQGAREGGPRDTTATWPGGTPVITSFQISDIECPATAPGQASVGHFTVNWTSEGADQVWIYWHGESAFTGYFDGPNGGDRIAATCRLGESFMLRAEARRGGEPGGTRDQTATWPAG